MDSPQITQLDTLFLNYLGRDKSIIGLETSRLTAQGENYGSQMLALKIRVKNKKQEEEELEVVAKLPPPGEFMKKMFNIPVTFKAEIDFYQTIVPELETFLQELGISDYLDCFPKLLGARLSLTKNEVDDDAVLLLENLKTQGFEMVDRTVGFDFNTAKLTIKAMAKYHAVPLALKILKPERFHKNLKPLFKPFSVFNFEETMIDNFVDKFRKIVNTMDTCKQYADRVADAFRSTYQMLKNDPGMVREPFATIIHTDVWVNNFMVKYQNHEPVACKIVDFQLGEFGSPARDFVFFIFTSVQIPVLKEHYEELVELYHQTLLEVLEKCGCDTTIFSFEALQKEICLALKEHEVYHCLMMLHPIYATQEQLKELDEYSEDDFSKEHPLPPKLKEKLEFLILEFVKREWI